MNRIRAAGALAACWVIAGIPAAQGQAKRDPTQSPASQRPPKTATKQTYAKELVQAGALRFGSECGFCHGRDAAGGETGPDLTRSKLVAEDNRGDQIAPVVRAGRPDQGMPAFKLSDTDLTAIVAFIHGQKAKADTLAGGRRGVDNADLASGNAAAGRRYFNGAGACSMCHSPTGDLAGVASRYEGLKLLLRMLYPGGGPAAARQDALSAHFDQLGKYTDRDMHNVYAYLVTLK